MTSLLKKIKLRREKKPKIDYFSLSNKEKIKLIAMFCLKWGLIILVPSSLIWILLVLFTNFSGPFFFQYSLQIIPAILLILGGCMGGLSRYNVPPKMRIIEPDDQAVTPSDFQIRVKYDPNDIDPTSIIITINEKKVQGKLDKNHDQLVVPKIFKTPPKQTITMLISVTALRTNGKEISDKIRIICDPESDEEDYIEYWEFKREDDTYLGKEMIAAANHARRNFIAIQLIATALLLIVVNVLISQLFLWITGLLV